MNRLLISPIFFLAILGITGGFLLGLDMRYNFYPSWTKLQEPPAKAVKILDVEYGNVIIQTQDGASYRCAMEGGECWSADLQLNLPEWADPNWEYWTRHYGPCDYTRSYFLFWKLPARSIVDCVDEREVFTDWGVDEVVVIDTRGSVWLHAYQWSAIGSHAYEALSAGLFGVLGMVLGLILVGIRALVHWIRQRHI